MLVAHRCGGFTNVVVMVAYLRIFRLGCYFVFYGYVCVGVCLHCCGLWLRAAAVCFGFAVAGASIFKCLLLCRFV